jgi:hypothetical protein
MGVLKEDELVAHVDRGGGLEGRISRWKGELTPDHVKAEPNLTIPG